MRRTLQAELTLIDGKLRRGVTVRVGRDGRIDSVEGPDGATAHSRSELPAVSPAFEQSTRGAPSAKRLRGRALLPGFVNAHSHAFQRLLRGRTEHRAHGVQGDDFWSWREAMYRVTDVLTPEDLEAVCRLAFLEMKLAGFTHVVEFHYLHHQPGGRPYADPAELARRVAAGAEFAGIGLTLLRVAYQRSGPGVNPNPQQLRFVDRDPDAYVRHLDATTSALGAGDRQVQVGIAAHSVRALDGDYLRALAAMSGDRPVHAHVSEQPREIALCLEENGMRPMEFLGACGLISPRFTAVHATHLGPGEAEILGSAGGGACICPTTERNLGDGLPNLVSLRESGVSLSIGSDSHARIDPFAELRQLEDGERLRTLSRNVLADGPGDQVAPALFDAATVGGARAAGFGEWGIRAGARADLVSISLDDPALAGLGGTAGGDAALLGGLVLGGHPRMVKDVWVAGRHEVFDGECLRWQQAVDGYRAVVEKIFG
jgi:formimidoylglutamate deiminase